MSSIPRPVRYIGIDEVGRGSWAGPLILCALAFPEGIHIPQSVCIRDSKALNRSQRERSSIFLRENSIFCFSFVSRGTIDRLGIHKATIRGLRSVARKISELIIIKENCTGEQYKERYCLKIDGRRICQLQDPHEFIVRGDQTEREISAASILAKVRRDAYMTRMARKYPHYGFERNAGYGTAEHRRALEYSGICEIHRLSYRPIKLYTGS